jgi:hypothetical protein
VEDDDGRRSIWIKGWGIQLKAFREACQKAGVKKPHKGDQFTATFTGYGERGSAPQPPKVYEYQIQPPRQRRHTTRTATAATAATNGLRSAAELTIRPTAAHNPTLWPAINRQQHRAASRANLPAGASTIRTAATRPAARTDSTLPQVNVMQLQQLQAAGKNLTDIAGLTGLTEQQVIEALQPTHQGSEDEPEF